MQVTRSHGSQGFGSHEQRACLTEMFSGRTGPERFCQTDQSISINLPCNACWRKHDFRFRSGQNIIISRKISFSISWITPSNNIFTIQNLINTCYYFRKKELNDQGALHSSFNSLICWNCVIIRLNIVNLAVRKFIFVPEFQIFPLTIQHSSSTYNMYLLMNSPQIRYNFPAE